MKARDWRKEQSYHIQLREEEYRQIEKAQELYRRAYGVKVTKHNIVVEAINLLNSNLESDLE